MTTEAQTALAALAAVPCPSCYNYRSHCQVCKDTCPSCHGTGRRCWGLVRACDPTHFRGNRPIHDYLCRCGGTGYTVVAEADALAWLVAHYVSRGATVSFGSGYCELVTAKDGLLAHERGGTPLLALLAAVQAAEEREICQRY